MARKYTPLGKYLQSFPSEKQVITLTFEKIEQIVDDTLPPSAFQYRAWWENEKMVIMSRRTHG